jgi:hypothetical protein
MHKGLKCQLALVLQLLQATMQQSGSLHAGTDPC